MIKEKSRRPTTRLKHHAKRAGWSTPKSRSVLHRPCSITSAATPTASRSPTTASSNVQNGQVTLSYRDRKDGDQKKTVSLEAHEFIRRFLLHVLPDGFMRIRHFGFLANRAKKHALPQCRKLLGLSAALPEIPKRSAHDLLLELTGIDLSRCPRCQQGTMIVIR